MWLWGTVHGGECSDVYPPKKDGTVEWFDTSPLKPPRMRRQTDSKEDLNKKKMIKKNCQNWNVHKPKLGSHSLVIQQNKSEEWI